MIPLCLRSWEHREEGWSGGSGCQRDPCIATGISWVDSDGVNTHLLLLTFAWETWTWCVLWNLSFFLLPSLPHSFLAPLILTLTPPLCYYILPLCGERECLKQLKYVAACEDSLRYFVPSPGWTFQSSLRHLLSKERHLPWKWRCHTREWGDIPACGTLNPVFIIRRKQQSTGQ